VIITCPSSLVWYVSIKTCNYPENDLGPCGSYYTTKTTTQSSPISTTTKYTSTTRYTPYKKPMKYIEKILNYLIESD
ncbi:unnamed protein product, partial [Brachionus calyciflorus]